MASVRIHMKRGDTFDFDLLCTDGDAAPPTTADRIWQIRVVASNTWRVG